MSSTRLRNSGLNARRSSAHHLVARAQVGPVLEELAADVRRHDDDGVAEVDRSSLTVGQAPVVQQLQQRVEHVRVRLLDLVEQDHGVGPAPHRFGQLPALVVADVSGRRADEPRHRVLLHVFGHVDADHVRLVVEQEVGERPRQLGLADAGRAQKDERADGPIRVLQTGARAAHRVRHRGHGLVLADDARVQLGLHVQQLGLLALQHLVDGDAGPLRHDRRDVFLRDLLTQERAVRLQLLQLFGLGGRWPSPARGRGRNAARRRD